MIREIYRERKREREGGKRGLVQTWNSYSSFPQRWMVSEMGEVG
jgi:hypothetical protein